MMAMVNIYLSENMIAQIIFVTAICMGGPRVCGFPEYFAISSLIAWASIWIFSSSDFLPTPRSLMDVKTKRLRTCHVRPWLKTTPVEYQTQA